jgi:hypothetical protein
MSKLLSLFLRKRSSVRPSGQDEKNRQKPPRTVSWNPHIEVWRQPSRSITWSTHVEVFIIPARERAPGDCDPAPRTTRTSFDDNEGIIASSCDDDTSAPYTWCSDDISTALEIKCDPLG